MSTRHPNLSPEDMDAMKAAYVRCRATRQHRLDPIPATAKPSFGAYAWYRCENCGMLRFDIVSVLTGEVLSRSYDPPPGYRDESGRTAREWRSEWFARLEDEGFLSMADDGYAHRLTGPENARKSPARDDRPKFRKPRKVR